MHTYRPFLDVLGFDDNVLEKLKINIVVHEEILDKYSIKKEGDAILIDASNKRSAHFAIYDVLNGIYKKEFNSSLKQRGVHLDCGRKYFSPDWIESLIVEIFKNKLNTIQLHFSENEGLRLEIEGYESLTSNEFITYEELNQILLLAKTLEIEVIPSFDSPGHLKHILSQNPVYLLKGIETGLDITSQQAREFIKGIYSKLLMMFKDSRSFHIGGDEFIDFDKFEDYPQIDAYAKEKFGNKASSIDAYVDYVNEIGKMIIDSGKEVQVWNDPFYRINQQSTVALNKDFIISYWTSWNRNMAPVKSFIEKGHRIVNYMDSLLYFVVGENAGYTYPTSHKIESLFEPHIFPNRNKEAARDTRQELSPNDLNLEGAMISIWCDKPEVLTQDEIRVKFSPLLRAFSNKCQNQ